MERNHWHLIAIARLPVVAKPFTAVVSACLPGTQNVRCITQALDPIKPSRISASQSWAFSWEWINLKGTVPKGGLIALACEHRVGEKRWFVDADGVYHSTDCGKTFNLSTIQ